MRYPTLKEVEAADRKTLGVWSRFLPSPGALSIGNDDFHEALERETKTMGRILERFKELGGWSPELSKEIGWS